MVDFFPNLAYINSYFETKSLAWKRDCMIYDISKTKNAMTLTKVILESSNKVLWTKVKFITVMFPMQFLQNA